MTDSISGQDISSRDRVGITSSMIYNQRPAAVLARKITYMGQANLDQYAPGALIRLEIPTSPGTFLQCGTTQIKFNLNARIPGGGVPPANSGYYFLDSTAASLIRRVRVYSGSSLIEDINEYSKIVELMSDAQKSNNECETVGFVEGNEGAPVPAPLVAQYITAPTAAGMQHVGDDSNRSCLDNANVRQTNLEWDSLLANVGQAAAVDQPPYQFTIPLMSGTIGTMCPKWFPLGAAGAAPIRVEIELNQNNAGVYQTVASNALGAVDWFLDHVEIHCDIVQLDGNAMRLVEQSVGGDFVVNTSTFRHSQAVVALGSNASSTLLPFRFSSVKCLLSRQYPQAAEVSLVRRSQSCAIRSNATEYHHMIGSSHVPTNSVRLGVSQQWAGATIMGASAAAGHPLEGVNRTWKQGAVDGVNELMKALHGKNILQVSNKLTTANWNNDRSNVNIAGNISATAGETRQFGGDAPKNTFTYACNLESQGKASDLVECGTSTISLQCFLNATYDPVTTQNNNLHSFCLHDLRLEFVGGVCIPRY